MRLECIGQIIPEEGIRVIDYYENDVIVSASGQEFLVPAVAVSNRYVKRRKKIPLKKRNLLIRDSRSCQYCGEELSPKGATIDHVKPRCKFKVKSHAHTWENTVIACYSCNSKKDNKTPEQAGMKLLTVPREPDPNTFYSGMSPWMKSPEEWKDYVRARV